MKTYTCRSCHHHALTEVLDLGVQPLANNLVPLEAAGDSAIEPKFPLRLGVCPQCWMLQILEVVPPVKLFSEYLYFSSFSDTMLAHAKDACTEYRERFGLTARSFVVEVASNDGYLLKNFVAAGIPSLGVEPAGNIAKVAEQAGVRTLNSFFSKQTAEAIGEKDGKASLILGNNVFAHVPDTNDFVAGLKSLLAPDGSVILEFPYGVDMIEKAEFDTIYHEHVFYFTLTALIPLFGRHGLKIYDVRSFAIHGGSLRIFVGHAETVSARPSVAELLAAEKAKGVDTMYYYRNFASAAAKIRSDLRDLLTRLKAEGASIAAYGASAKGSTLLNYADIGTEFLDFIVDRSTVKQGRLSPGKRIPIMAPSELLQRRPQYTVLLTWNFAEEILRQQEPYRKAGGRFIVPIPKVQVIE